MAVTWHNITITRINSNNNNIHLQESRNPKEAQSQKRVTWSDSLTDTKTITPRRPLKSSFMKGGPLIKAPSRIDTCITLYVELANHVDSRAEVPPPQQQQCQKLLLHPIQRPPTSTLLR